MATMGYVTKVFRSSGGLLLALVACEQRAFEPIAGELSAALVTTSLAPYEAVDLIGPVQFTYAHDPAQLMELGLPPRRCDGVMTESGRGYSLSLEGSVCTTSFFNLPETAAAYSRPYVNPNFHYAWPSSRPDSPNTGSSLQLTLPPRTQRTTPDGVPCAGSSSTCILPGPDRAELTVHTDGFEADHGVGFNFDNPKYFAFLMYLHAPSGFSLAPGSSGEEGVHFMQAWQYPTPGAVNCGVPLVATLENAEGENAAVSPVQFYLGAHDQAGGHHVGDQRWPLTVNAWHRFVFFLSPNNNATAGKGQITAWLNGKLLVDWHEDWGCNVSGSAATHTDQWHLRVGMYRTDSGPIDQRLDMFFDNIRVAPSKQLATAH